MTLQITDSESLKLFRIQAGLTQVQLAEKLGLTQPAISMFEKRKMAVSKKLQNRILTVFGESDEDSK